MSKGNVYYFQHWCINGEDVKKPLETRNMLESNLWEIFSSMFSDLWDKEDNICGRIVKSIQDSEIYKRKRNQLKTSLNSLKKVNYPCVSFPNGLENKYVEGKLPKLTKNPFYKKKAFYRPFSFHWLLKTEKVPFQKDEIYGYEFSFDNLSEDIQKDLVSFLETIFKMKDKENRIYDLLEKNNANTVEKIIEVVPEFKGYFVPCEKYWNSYYDINDSGWQRTYENKLDNFLEWPY